MSKSWCTVLLCSTPSSMSYNPPIFLPSAYVGAFARDKYCRIVIPPLSSWCMWGRAPQTSWRRVNKRRRYLNLMFLNRCPATPVLNAPRHLIQMHVYIFSSSSSSSSQVSFSFVLSSHQCVLMFLRLMVTASIF